MFQLFYVAKKTINFFPCSKITPNNSQYNQRRALTQLNHQYELMVNQIPEVGPNRPHTLDICLPKIAEYLNANIIVHQV